MTNPGWRALTPKDAANEESEEAKSGGKVLILKPGLSLTAESGRVLNKSTKAPSRFTKASLIKQPEQMGIGRPSTYAAIIKNIMEREYLNESKKYLIPTEVGYLIVDSLVGNFAFAEYDFTKELEESLDHIAEGHADYRTIVSKVNDRLCRDIGNLRLQRSSFANSTASTGGPQSSTGVATCPACKKGTIRQIKSAKGTFWGCTGYQKDGGCKFAIDGAFGKKTHSEAVIKQLCEKLITTQVIKGLQNKEGKKYDAKLKLSENFKVQPSFSTN
jgi:DNA topoisomerase I